MGAWTFFVALAVYAYDAGGAAAVGAAAVVRMVPAGLAAPFAGALIDRRRAATCCWPRWSPVPRCWPASPPIAAGAPIAVVFALATFFTIAATAHKPAQGALLPSLVETPRSSAPATRSGAPSTTARSWCGSLIGGALVALASVEVAFAVTAGAVRARVDPGRR